MTQERRVAWTVSDGLCELCRPQMEHVAPRVSVGSIREFGVRIERRVGLVVGESSVSLTRTQALRLLGALESVLSHNEALALGYEEGEALARAEEAAREVPALVARVKRCPECDGLIAADQEGDWCPRCVLVVVAGWRAS